VSDTNAPWKFDVTAPYDVARLSAMSVSFGSP
jgi:hypothetical protein